MLAVRRAAGIAAAVGAELVLASAYVTNQSAQLAMQSGTSLPVDGAEEARAVLGDAREVATAEGVEKIREVVEEGTPVDALIGIANKVEADLLIVGNRGINSLTGRLLGSVPADIARQAECDVMIVNTGY